MKYRMLLCTLALVLTVFAPELVEAQGNTSLNVDVMIEQLQEFADEPSAAKNSIESAIDALSRLSDFPPDLNSRKSFNRSLEIAKFQNSFWKLPPDKSGFEQLLQFSGRGGSWRESQETKPFGFNMLLTPGRIRLSYASGTQIVDKTYKYSFVGDTIQLTRNNKVLIFTKWNPKIAPK